MTPKPAKQTVKAQGIHYTPPELANFLATQLLRLLPSTDPTLQILDPACGDGELLVAVKIAAGNRRVRFIGVDQDLEAIKVARQRLLRLGVAVEDLDLRCADFLDVLTSEVAAQSTLLGVPGNVASLLGTCDAVISNPPYVRTQILGTEETQRLATMFGLTGRVDLYHAFVAAMTVALKDGGALALLCSNRFLTTKSGTSIRELLSHQHRIHQIIDLGDTKCFKAAVLPAIVLSTKAETGSETTEFVSIYEQRNPTDSSITFQSLPEVINSDYCGDVLIGETTFKITRGLAPDLRKGTPWTLRSGTWVETVHSNTRYRLGDIGKIRVGIKTTADAVFIRADWDSLPPELHPEEELLLPLLTHQAASRWRGGPAPKRVLYPYQIDQPKRTPIVLEDWPKALRYLESHRERLASRKYVIDAGREWWEMWVPQKPNQWAVPKIVFPDISEEPRFSLDETGAVINGDCYWMALDKTEPPLACLALAVSNSTFATQYYDEMCGNRLYAGRRRYMTQYVETFPLPDPETQTAQKAIVIVKDLTSGRIPAADITDAEGELDVLVRQSFGLN